ncbi:MAG: hypothetical protein ABFS23_12230, partial [Pseudomonadota bacterium]
MTADPSIPPQPDARAIGRLVRDLLRETRADRTRRLLLITGPPEWACAAAEQVVASQEPGRVLWVGSDGPERVPCLLPAGAHA